MEILDSLIQYFINGITTKKTLYYFLVIVVLRSCLFFHKRGLKRNPIISVLGLIIIISIWEPSFHKYFGNPWILHTLAILLVVYYITLSFKRTYSYKAKQERREFIKRFLFVIMELSIIFFIIYRISIKTEIMFF